MNSKTKILIGILVLGIVLIGGFLYFHLFFNCVGEMQEIKPGQHCCFGLKAQRISIPVISNKPQFYCVPPKMEESESVKKGNSILRLKGLCLLNDGRKFNAECENKEVILNNLWLYPVKEKEKLTDGFYLYSSDTFSGVSPIAVSGEVSLMEGSFITVYTEDNQDLFEEIKNKTKAIEKPIPVTIKGLIKPSELCTQNAPCRYGLFIVVQNISYESATKTDREVTITTDKTEYKQGKDIKITLENNLNESIFAYVKRIPISCFCIESIERKTSEGSWEKLYPAGNNLELLASISKAKETIQELIRVLDELYKTIQLGSTPNIEARIKEYLNISVLAVEKVEKISSEFQSTTDIQLSLKEYHEIKSRFYDGLIDISRDSFLLTSYLDEYLKDPKNHSVLDKTKNQIKKVRRTAYSLKNFYASLIEPQEIKPGQYETFEWAPLLKGTPLPIQASPGKYRINAYVWINGIKKNFYSNEFVIEEK